MIAFPRQPDMRQFLGTARFSPLMLMILAGLGALVVAAAVFAAYAIVAPDPSPPASASIDWKVPRPSTDDLGPPRLANLDTQILTRPIFNKDRRPIVKAVAKPPPSIVSDTPTGLKVTAIVKRRQESRAFVSSANGKGDWKSVGEKVDDWTISEIGPEQLIVTNGEATARLELYSDKPVADNPQAQSRQAQPNPEQPDDFVEPPEQRDPAEAELDKDLPPGAEPPPQPPQPQVSRPPPPPPQMDPAELRRNMRR